MFIFNAEKKKKKKKKNFIFHGQVFVMSRRCQILTFSSLLSWLYFAGGWWCRDGLMQTGQNPDIYFGLRICSVSEKKFFFLKIFSCMSMNQSQRYNYALFSE